MKSSYQQSAASREAIEQTSACRRIRERRKQKVRGAIYALFRHRRRVDRRSMFINTAYYVDTHETPTLLLVLAIMLLCIADAYFTLAILNAGGRELNPLMNKMIAIDEVLFFTVKYSLTAVCIFLLLWHKRFRIFRYFTGERILVMVFSLYLVLFNYELFLLNQSKAIPLNLSFG